MKPQAFVDDTFGLPTVTDILRELEKPGRDPRPAFKAAVFKEGVETLKDLKRGMILEGTVTNVAAFGAFVDIGVHQDGLVHVSAMSKTFIKDPREVVKSGDIVKVKVLEVEVARKRIALTLRLDDETGAEKRERPRGKPRATMASSAPRKPAQAQAGGALAEALRRAGEKSGRGKTGGFAAGTPQAPRSANPPWCWRIRRSASSCARLRIIASPARGCCLRNRSNSRSGISYALAAMSAVLGGMAPAPSNAISPNAMPAVSVASRDAAGQGDVNRTAAEEKQRGGGSPAEMIFSPDM